LLGGAATASQVRDRDLDLMDLRRIHDWSIRPIMRTVPGAAEINSWGGFEQQYQVRVDPEKILKYDVTFQQIENALRGSNLNVGGGMVSSAHGVFPVPAPATVKLLGRTPVYSGPVQKELVSVLRNTAHGFRLVCTTTEDLEKRVNRRRKVTASHGSAKCSTASRSKRRFGRT